MYLRLFNLWLTMNQFEDLVRGSNRLLMLIELTATPWPRGSRALFADIGSIHDPCQVRLGRVQTGARRASQRALRPARPGYSY